MAQDHDGTDKKTYAEAVGGDDVGETVNGGTMNGRRESDSVKKDDSESLYSLICLAIGSILFPNSKIGETSSSLLQRIRNSVADNGPKLKKAFKRTSQEILLWTRRGSHLRSLLVITMGTIVVFTTMALVVFTLFFVAATANAIIISLLISLAVAGGFFALFFLCLSGVYIGALSFAAFVVSTVTVSAVVSVLIASGWIGFFYVVWLGTRGSLRLAKQSVSVMGSAISGNSLSRHLHQQEREVNIESSN
ncbi:unnamed protein product [Cochlearia groenlandica]